MATGALTGLGLVSAPPAGAAGWLTSPAAPAHITTSGGASQEAAGGAAVTGGGVVTLVTGDRVRVTTYSDGRLVGTILRGSPHFGDPVNAVQTNDASYVIPMLPVAERMKLDVSLFNISALLVQHGDRVGVEVRFAPGVDPHAVPGLTVHPADARRTPGGATVVPASYGRGTAGVEAAKSTWRGVASVALPSLKQPAVPASYRLHTLTVHVTNRLGNPVRFEQAWVVNVDDAKLFNAPFYILHGVGKVSVPEGNYAVFAGSFSSLLVRPDFSVTADRDVVMSLTDATVHPTEAVPGFKVADSTVSLIRYAERRGGFGESFVSFAAFPFHLQPVPAQLPHGSAHSAVSATMAPKGEFSQGLPPDVPSTLAYPKDYQAGVPASMGYTHTRSDFAVVPQRFSANTPAGTRYSDAISFAPFEIFGFAFSYLVHVPGVRTVLLQGNRHLRWIQDFDATMPRGRAFKLATLTKDSFYTPGAASPVNFAHGPVGPGLEAGYDRGSTGPFCLLCRHGNRLHGGLPLFSGAGTAMSGLLWNPEMGGWTLRHSYHVLASGHYVIAPDVSLPADAQTYTLTASSHPGTSAWQLSKKVTDSWRFTSAAGDGVVPLLMASYLPSTTLAGTLRPGPVSWPLDFGNLGPADAAVSKATVSLSTDGGHTWRPATVTRTDRNSFAVSYTNPAAAGTTQYMSVRVTGLDAAGRTVTETAISAYRLTMRTSDGPTARPAVDVTPTDSATLGRQVPGLGTRACAHATKTRSSCYTVVMAGESGSLLSGGEPAGLGANDIRDAYDIPNSQSQQTVAVVVAYDYPTAEADLATYRRHYGLPACTTGNGCFRKINQRGDQGSYPDPDPGWSVEAALDMQMISAACPSCRIVLAEADLPSGKDLAATTNAAVAAGAKVTNHSYGIGEHTGVRFNNAAYDHPGVTAVAASGDSGYGPASFPASSSSVIAVGGTVLHHADNPRGWRENAWQYGGSGCSAYFAKRDWQHDKACSMRTYADLSAVAYGVAVYNSYALGPHRAWLEVAGTSISSPLVAGLIGAAGAGGIKPGHLYGTQGSFHDVHLGSNGFCHGSYLCTAKPGYDGPTGWGTPRGLTPFGGQPTGG